MSKEDIDLIWQKINCEACYTENYCKEKCECKCREFIALENILNRIEELEEENKIYRRQLNSAYDRGFIHIDKIKEIVEECIPAGKNIITGKKEYQPNANANSYLTQTILELLKDGGK